MTVYEFIFTRKTLQRYYRHVVFWSIDLGKMALSNIVGMFASGSALTAHDIGQSFKLAIFFLPLDMIYTYTLVYYLFPKFFDRKRYTLFALTITLMALANYIAGTWYIKWFFGIVLSSADQWFGFLWHMFMLFLFSGSHFICCYFLAARIFKNYYERMSERETLSRENASAELQLLKAQVHPHFLFNTLNNIYSFTLTRPGDALKLVENLSEMMKYMMTEGDLPSVPIHKEIRLLTDYIELEKVRYGNFLKVHVAIVGNADDKKIAPLLLIPFVENSFKHGASMQLTAPWIRLNIKIIDTKLIFSLANSRPSDPVLPTEKSGIGLRNVKKRLNLLYPGTHLLTIAPGAGEYSVCLEVPLLKEK